MNRRNDQDLLTEYTEHGAEAAFAEVVRIHIDFVYSVALRIVWDPHLAKDVTQGVFIALAQNARRLADRPDLSGWLHCTARNLGAKTVRTEERRRAREQESAAMKDLSTPESDTDWQHIAPQLDAALGELSESDRDAVLLRYFRGKSASEMAQVLGISQVAAQKRVSRAVERLRDFFVKRGVTIGASELVVSISANAVHTAPSELAATVSTLASVAGTYPCISTTVATTKAIIMTTFQKAIIAAAISAAAVVGFYEARQASSLRRQNEFLQQQETLLADRIQELQHQRDGAANRLLRGDKIAASRVLNSDRLRELLKLRGEVGILRQQVHKFQEMAAAATNELRALPERRSATASAPKSPAPFQLQLVADEPGEDSETVTNHDGTDGTGTMNLQKTPLMDAVAISSATVDVDSNTGQPQIDIEFSEVGKELFAAITRENLNKRLAIVLEGQIYSAPVITSEIADGKAVITGSFTEDEARNLAAKITEAIEPK